MFLLVSLVSSARSSMKHEENGVIVGYSWGKVCVGVCLPECYDCVEWNEGNVENSEFEYDELWVENNNGTSTAIRFPLRHGKDAKPESPKGGAPRPSIHKKFPREMVEPEANGCAEKCVNHQWTICCTNADGNKKCQSFGYCK